MSTREGMRRIAGDADRIAVIDAETTGVYNSDRVVEIGIVTMSLDGDIVDEWETLVHPARDVGPSWLHQITASGHSTKPKNSVVFCNAAWRQEVSNSGCHREQRQAEGVARTRRHPRPPQHIIGTRGARPQSTEPIVECV